MSRDLFGGAMTCVIPTRFVDVRFALLACLPSPASPQSNNFGYIFICVYYSITFGALSVRDFARPSSTLSPIEDLADGHFEFL